MPWSVAIMVIVIVSVVTLGRIIREAVRAKSREHAAIPADLLASRDEVRQLKERVAVLERLEKAEPKNALALFYLGAADFAKGDKPAAARRWKTLLAMLPSDAPIRGMLEAKIKETE